MDVKFEPDQGWTKFSRVSLNVNMDTNLVKNLIALMEAKNAATAVSQQNTVLIVTMILAAIAPTLASILAYFKAATAKQTGDKNTESLKEIHVAVNSKETATAKKIDELQEMVKTLTREKATADEQLKSQTLASTVAAAVASDKKK